MPAITSGKFETRAELERAIVQHIHQKDTMRTIALKCHISTRSVTRMVQKLGLDDLVHPPGKRPARRAKPVMEVITFVQSPCWKAHCEDSCCAFHQEAGHV
jgi:hypothetical protein